MSDITQLRIAAADHAPPDPFTPENLLLRQDFTQAAGVKKLVTTVPVRKPGPQDFVRCHASPEYRGNFLLLEIKDDREIYVVANPLQGDLVGEAHVSTLDLAINR